MKGLLNHTMKLAKTTNQPLTRINKTILVAEEIFRTYEGKSTEPQNNLNRGMSINIVVKYPKEDREDMVNSFLNAAVLGCTAVRHLKRGRPTELEPTDINANICCE